eukprot:TRINITY_DN5097_c0_g1_i1.p1 TRINITY_DN5097_c0_g1~~TRINITY_DN5097_c0_g1_i1.p1  ORF type:complete len:109 (+),score=3.62 TRINITY_DN5097_c0_g1_i1:33-359(+)
MWVLRLLFRSLFFFVSFFFVDFNKTMGSGKPRGLRAARKLRLHRKDQRWADKQYKKAHFGTALKANPFGGASHAKGIVLEKIGIEAKQPSLTTGRNGKEWRYWGAPCS